MPNKIISITIVFILVSLFLIGIYNNYYYLIYIPLFFLICLGLINIIRLFQLEQIKNEFKTGSIKFVNDSIQIVAFLCAGLYFLYQIVGNLDITDLSLKIDTERISRDSSSDYLALKVKLEKGPIASLHLHDIKAYLYGSDYSYPIDSFDFVGIRRQKIDFNDSLNKLTTYYNAIDSSETYRLAANESTQFSAYKTVLKNQPVRIEVTVVGERWKLLYRVKPQFKATVISLPIDK